MRADLMRRLALVAALLFPVVGQAGEAVPVSDDPVLEERVMRLSHDLRCLVCQNQSIAESNAPLAVDLRNQVREQFLAGKDEAAVVDYLVARYGDFVLYLPPFKGATLLLWLGPGLLLVAGAGWLGWRLRRRVREVPPPLSAEEHARASALLDGSAKPSQESRS
ncbi:MAG: cytochrome c-type biogenesis protein CcmH [Pseudomonas sagittaria]|uniref:cytochrome c-type biogenesis protein n=1 Tax=Aromatoleum sp. (strain CIB) TaxID=198107 RepID=UPI0006A2ED6F|nr:cytochrome c-type biogenesis protein [Azoarcus sp. CIB]MCM2331423.1 cytochrome c-type biogenesis protein CcmH [Pseudomonas sagittaria]